MYRRLCVVTGIVFLLTATAARADDKKDLDEALEAWVTAFNGHDARAVAETYALDAELIETTGERFKGRAAIEKNFAEFFAKNPNVKTKISDVSRKFLKPDVVVEDGKFEGWGRSEGGLPTKGEYTAIVVKQNGKWLVVHERGAVPVKKADEQKSATAEKRHKAWRQYLKGEWAYEITGVPGVESEKGTATWRRAAKGNAVVGRFTDEDGNSAVELGGYRADAKMDVAIGYGSQGDYWHLELKFPTDAPEGVHYGKLPDGRSFKGQFKAKKVDQNHFEWNLKGKAGDGEDLDVTGKYTRKTE